MQSQQIRLCLSFWEMSSDGPGTLNGCSIWIWIETILGRDCKCCFQSHLYCLYNPIPSVLSLWVGLLITVCLCSESEGKLFLSIDHCYISVVLWTVGDISPLHIYKCMADMIDHTHRGWPSAWSSDTESEFKALWIPPSEGWD